MELVSPGVPLRGRFRLGKERTLFTAGADGKGRKGKERKGYDMEKCMLPTNVYISHGFPSFP